MDKAEEKKQIVLPYGVASKVDLGRLIREVEALNEFLKQAAIREPGTPIKMPKSTRLMDEIISNNELNLLHEEEREYLKNYLETVKAKAPILHMSFSADPTPAFTKKIIKWLRTNIHPYVLIDVGLQPALGAGCIVRTTNKFFDFSLRQGLTNKRDVLLEAIRKETSKQAAEPEQTEEQPAPEGAQQSASEQSPEQPAAEQKHEAVA